MQASGGELEAGGRRPTIRNLDRVIFPRAGTTKAQLLDYYAPEHKPPWVPTVPVWSRDRVLHTSLDLHRPTALAFDFDPGEGVDVLGCARVALRVREVLDGIALAPYVKTSGSKAYSTGWPCTAISSRR